MIDCANQTGTLCYRLGFLINNNNNLSWGGIHPINNLWYLDKINKLRSMDGEVFFTFGGESGQEIANVIEDVSTLVNTYQNAIDLYKMTTIEFYLEDSALSDDDVIDRRNKALFILKKNNPSLKIHYSLTITLGGFSEVGKKLYRNIYLNLLDIDLYNIVVVGYGARLPVSIEDWNTTDDKRILEISSALIYFNSVYADFFHYISSVNSYVYIGLTFKIGNNPNGDIFLPSSVNFSIRPPKDSLRRFYTIYYSILTANRDVAQSVSTVQTNDKSGCIQDKYQFIKYFSYINEGIYLDTPGPLFHIKNDDKYKNQIYTRPLNISIDPDLIYNVSIAMKNEHIYVRELDVWFELWDWNITIPELIYAYDSLWGSSRKDKINKNYYKDKDKDWIGADTAKVTEDYLYRATPKDIFEQLLFGDVGFIKSPLKSDRDRAIGLSDIIINAMKTPEFKISQDFKPFLYNENEPNKQYYLSKGSEIFKWRYMTMLSYAFGFNMSRIFNIVFDPNTYNLSFTIVPFENIPPYPAEYIESNNRQQIKFRNDALSPKKLGTLIRSTFDNYITGDSLTVLSIDPNKHIGSYNPSPSSPPSSSSPSIPGIIIAIVVIYIIYKIMRRG
jgi:hypothetical protein